MAGRPRSPSALRALLAWAVVLPWVAWAVVRLLGLERGYPLVPLVAFTPYAAGLATVAVLAALVLRRRAPAAVGALAALALVAAVAPRALADGDAPRPPGGPTLRVLTTNVSAGGVAADELVALVRRERVDVLAVQELTPGMPGRLRAAGLERALPHRVLRPRPGARGTGLWARVPLTARPGPRGTAFAHAVGRLRPAGGPPVEVVSVHSMAPTRGAVIGRWAQDMRALPRAGGERLVRVLAGDFNATLDHEELRDVLARGYVDAAEETGAGLAGTWPADRRLPPPVAIDHVLADRRAGVRDVRVLDLDGTDHRPVLAELALPRR